MIDSHCHLDDPRLDFETAVRSARECGVSGAIIPGYGPERWPRQGELLLSPGDFSLWGGFGFHPWALSPEQKAQDVTTTLQQGLERYAPIWGDRLVAIGEFGLDRSRAMSERPLELQKIVFREHLRLARQTQLPVILHLVKADGLALKLLACDPPSAGVVHGFSGHAETIPRYAEFGLFFGFGAGLLRYPKICRALRATPLDRLLFETDDPLGTTNLEQIVQAASQILGKSVEYLRKQHSENCVRVFKL